MQVERMKPMNGQAPGVFGGVRWLAVVCGAAVLWGGSGGGVWGDDTRYQLGKRVQRFERRFEGTSEAERERTLPFLKDAVTAFFAFDLASAGRELDRASQVLDSEPELTDDQRQLVEGLLGVNLSFARRGVELGAEKWPGELRLGYVLLRPLPKVTLMLRVGEGAEQEWSFEKLPAKFAVDLAGLPAGDHEVRGEVRAGEVRVKLPVQRMSLIADAQARLKRLEERLAPKKVEKEKKGEGAEQTEEAKEAKETKDTKDTKEAKEAEPEEEPQPAVKLGDATVVATLKESLRMVRRLLEKDDAETDLPGARLLQEAEELAGGESGAGGRKLWQRPGEYWVTLASGTRMQRARLLIPATQVRQGTGEATGDATGERAAGAEQGGIGGQEGERAPRRPLVVALHGAGGSENMFFDAYGAGKIVRLCEERGWMLVSLGTSPLGGGLELPVLVDVLGEHYPVDEGRVAVVGHSMGAMQGLQLAGRNPRALRSLAILGGGRPVRSPAVLRGVDLFAAAGAEDFGRGGVKQVIAQWRKAGLPIEERDYPQVEHLGVVQVALDDVFAQFEKSFARVGGTEQ